KTRRAMGKQAVALARAVEYVSAGTVEFIVDAKRRFYFLEMNTRLQVEHPVTEMVTGLDLVELMIRIAAGDALPFKQKDLSTRGWAVESRVYAENPFREFLPSTGRLVRYLPPPESRNVRVDTGVFEGGEVSMYYDPMIAKLVTFGETRDDAIQYMRKALNEYYIRGVDTNIPFLAAIMAHPRFSEGRLSTNFIADEYPHGFGAEDTVLDDLIVFICVASAIHYRYLKRAARIDGQMPGYRRNIGDDWVVVINGNQYPVAMEGGASGTERIHYDGREHALTSTWQFGQPLFRGTLDGSREISIQVERRDLEYWLFKGGVRVKALVLSPREAELYRLMPEKRPPDLSRFLLSPMPGLLLKLSVAAGDVVRAGQALVVIEAMKMENVLRAAQDGCIAKLLAAEGDNLSVDQPILEFEE
ncbi:MAG TPA: biotin/lipoyl-containing protein, partial [Gammaproteobacteria bacterium]